MPKSMKYLLPAIGVAVLLPLSAYACGCGCGVFDVSTGSMMATDVGGTAWLEYDFAVQNQNRSGTHTASRDDNEDKMIRTHFVTAGAQYFFSRAWGAQITVPYWNRDFKTTTDDPNPGDTSTFNSKGFGDIRLKAIYSGLSDDMSTGLTFGVKLPSGKFNTAGFDRDTQIGTGSTDLLFGAYHMGELSKAASLNWFVHGEWDQPVAVQDHYRPGDEINLATGIYYNGFNQMGEFGKISPLFQVIGSGKMRDRGANAHPEDTGYTKLFLSPGIEYDVKDFKLYADVEVPVYENVSGNQLSAPVQFKVVVGYNF